MTPSTVRCTRCGRELTLDGPDGEGVRCATGGVWLRVASGSGPGVRHVYCRLGEPSPPSPPSSAPDRRTFGLDAVDGPTPARVAVLGRYTLAGTLGAGGMGVVHRAWDPELDRWVALKVLARGGASPQLVERFRREARSAARLDHPHLVRVFDLGEEDGTLFFAMELVEGPSLGDVLEHAGRLPVEEAVRLAEQAARGLAAAHAEGFVHRDIKPGNLLIRQDGHLLVGDFGLVLDPSVTARLTRTEQVLGTPAYMAPEQVRGEAVGPAVDQYGLGAVLYEAVAGCRPYAGDTALSLQRAILEGPPAPLREVAPGLPRDLALVVETAMARSPAHRYPSMTAFADDLARLRRGEPVEAAPPSGARRVRRWLRRHRRLGGGLLGLASAAVLVLAVLSFQSAQETWAAASRQAAAAERWATLREHLVALEPQDPVAAEQAFEAFVAEDAHRGTPALAAAWRWRGARLEASGEPERAEKAWAQAFAVTDDASARRAPLRRLAERALLDGAWDRALVVADALEEAGGDPDDVRGYRAVARWALQDVEGAVAAGAPTTGRWASLALADALQHARRWEGWGRLHALPGRPDRVLHTADDRTRVLTLEAEPGVVDQWAVGPGVDQVAYLFADGALHGLAWAPAAGRGWFLPPGGWTGEGTQAVEDPAAPSATVAWDVDGDGQRELLVGFGPYTRAIRTFRWRAGRWAEEGPFDDVVGSDVAALTACDLDGDGVDELAVALGPWSAYAVQVYAAAPDRPRRLASRRTGYVTALACVARPGGGRRLAALKVDAYPNATVFPEPPHHGPWAGLYLLSLDGGALVEDARVDLVPRAPDRDPVQPVRRPPDGGGSLVSGDFDGDGLDDLAAWVGAWGPYLDLWRGLPDGGFAPPLQMADVYAGWVHDLDDDGDDELIVTHDGALWAMGLGDVPFPGRAPRLVPPREETDVATDDPALRVARRRAEDLVRMGLVTDAARSLVALGPLGDAAFQARTALRSAALFREARRPRASADRYRAAADHPDTRVEALRGLAEVLADDLRFDEAHAAAVALVAASSGDPEAHAAASALRDRVASHRADRSLTLDGGAPLPAAATLGVAGAVRRVPGEGLTLRATNADGVLLRVPFTWEGGVLDLRVEATVRRSEWASGVRFRVRHPETDRILAARLGVVGGAGTFRRAWSCHHEDGQTVWIGYSPMPSADTVDRVVWHLGAAGDRLRCRIDVDGRTTAWRTAATEPLPSGRWVLEVVAGGDPAIDDPLMAEVELASLAIVGARVSEGGLEDAPLRDGLRRLADGASTEALDRLAAVDAGPARDLAVAVAHLERADYAAAEDALGRLATAPDADAWIVPALRRGVRGLPQALARVAGERQAAWSSAALDAAIRAHPGDRALAVDLTAWTGGAPPPAPPDEAFRFFQARANAWRERGDPDSALRDAASALALDGASLDDRRRLQRLRLEAWLGLAAREEAEAEAVALLRGPDRAYWSTRLPRIADLVPDPATWERLVRRAAGPDPGDPASPDGSLGD